MNENAKQAFTLRPVSKEIPLKELLIGAMIGIGFIAVPYLTREPDSSTAVEISLRMLVLVAGVQYVVLAFRAAERKTLISALKNQAGYKRVRFYDDDKFAASRNGTYVEGTVIEDGDMLTVILHE